MRASASTTPSSGAGAADLTVKAGGGGGGGGGSGGLDLSVRKPRSGAAPESDAAPTDYSSGGAGGDAAEKFKVASSKLDSGSATAAPEDLSSSSKDK